MSGRRGLTVGVGTHEVHVPEKWLGAILFIVASALILSRVLAAECQDVQIRGIYDGPDPMWPVMRVCVPECGGIDVLPTFAPLRTIEGVEEFEVEEVRSVPDIVLLLDPDEIESMALSRDSRSYNTGCSNVFDCVSTAYDNCAGQRAHARMVVYVESGGENACTWQCSNNRAGRLACDVEEQMPTSDGCNPQLAYPQCHPCFVGPVQPGACDTPDPGGVAAPVSAQ